MRIVLGSARRSEVTDPAFSPTTSTPARMACRLNSVERTVKQTEARMFARRLGVPRQEWMANSIACEKTGMPKPAASDACFSFFW